MGNDSSKQDQKLVASDTEKELNSIQSCNKIGEDETPAIHQDNPEVTLYRGVFREDEYCDSEASETTTDSSLDEEFSTPLVSYNLSLFCSTDNIKSTSTVSLHTPRTVLDIKLAVEKEFDIPACCQHMTFESSKLRDKDSIKLLRIREGDMLIIKYASEAMVKDIREIIQAMKEMRGFLRKKTTRQLLAKGDTNSEEIADSIDGEIVRLLGTTYFSPPEDEKSNANRQFFLNNNGLQILNQLHTELLRYPLQNCTLEMLYLERAILTVLWNLSAAFPRLFPHQKSTVDAVMYSLVRTEIPTMMYLPIVFGSLTIRHDVIFTAIGTLGNFSDIPECQVAIASRRDVLDQLVATLTCPSFNHVISLLVSASFVSLSHNFKTHPHFISGNLIEKLERVRKQNLLMNGLVLLQYFVTIFYAQLLHTSVSKISIDIAYKMYEAINKFLETAKYIYIHEEEKKYGFFWSTTIPFVKLAYFPRQNPQRSFARPGNSGKDNELLHKLEELCIEIGIFSLQDMLLSDQVRDIFIAESMVDYIVCLPWHLSTGTKAHRRVCDLKNYLSLKLQLQPPSLVNLTKAKLAATHCGLDKVLKATSLHDIVDNIGV